LHPRQPNLRGPPLVPSRKRPFFGNLCTLLRVYQHMDAHTQSAKDVLKALETTPEGLEPREVQARRKAHGPNTMPSRRAAPIWVVFVQQFASPLIYILLIAGAAELVLGQYPGAAFIFGVLLINAVIGTVQEHSATREASALQELRTPRAYVRRAGKVQDIQARDLVPGDIVLLESGAGVPADLRLLEANRLALDESALTGESRQTTKDPQAVLEASAAMGDRANMAFAGTAVARGQGVGVVVATGPDSQMGAIAQEVAADSRADSPLIIRMRVFTYQVASVVAVLIGLVVAILAWRGMEWVDILHASIGLAVAAIPEGLPVTVTIALALAMRRMGRRGVIVRKLPAVEALGSCTLIAADKTGTLTQNDLEVERVVLSDGTVRTLDKEQA